MKIRSFSINGLYDKFSYKINLDNEDHITILVGPNGCGKTTLLKIINDFLSGNYHALSKIFFHNIEFELQNSSIFRIYYNAYFLMKQLQSDSRGYSFFGNLNISEENFLFFEFFENKKQRNECFFKLGKEGFYEYPIEKCNKINNIDNGYFIELDKRRVAFEKFKNEFLENRDYGLFVADPLFIDYKSFLDKKEYDFPIFLKDVEKIKNLKQILDSDISVSEKNKLLEGFLVDDAIGQLRDIFLKSHIGLFPLEQLEEFETDRIRNELLISFIINDRIHKSPIVDSSDELLHNSEPSIIKMIKNANSPQLISDNRQFIVENINQVKKISFGIEHWSAKINGLVRIALEDFKSNYHELNQSFEDRLKLKIKNKFVPPKPEPRLQIDNSPPRYVPNIPDYGHYSIGPYEECLLPDLILDPSYSAQYPLYRPDLTEKEKLIFDYQRKEDWENINKTFDFIHTRFMLFCDTVKSYLPNILIGFNREEGLYLFDEIDKKPVIFNQLSSGEQQVILLFASILFDPPNDSLVMIDEPEISWHITWQRQFIHNLVEITTKIPYYFLISTHSPSIIYDRDDLVVELGETT